MAHRTNLIYSAELKARPIVDKVEIKTGEAGADCG